MFTYAIIDFIISHFITDEFFECWLEFFSVHFSIFVLVILFKYFQCFIIANLECLFCVVVVFRNNIKELKFKNK